MIIQTSLGNQKLHKYTTIWGDDHDIKVKELEFDGWYMWWPAVRAMPEVQLNYGYSAKLHCDKNNLGPSFIIGWGLAQDERSLKNPARFVNAFCF